MSISDFSTLVARHRAYFRTGATRSAAWREAQLTALRAMMTDRAEDFYAALWTDLRRNRTDADLTDVKFLATEADHALSHLRQWMKPVLISTPPVLGPARVQVQFDPLGVGLIIGTWNYPLMLTLSPLIAAIAGGNAAVVKPSEVAPATADVIARLLPEYLDQDAFSVVLGARPETTALLEQQWDHIFFTGGTAVAKVVMTAAAKNRTPVVLELGGKSPTIFHSSADLRVAARRIAQGRSQQRRPDLHRTGLRPAVQGRCQAVPRTPEGSDPSLLRQRPAEESGLRPDRQHAPLRPVDGTARERDHLPRRPARPGR
jgi:acyl-CoA reductase-like NAD-dependent aldehyde dehydrogenase